MALSHQEEAQIRRIIELEVRTSGAATSAEALSQLNKRATETVTGFEKVKDVVDAVQGAFSQFIGKVNSFGALFGADALGLASSINLMKGLATETIHLSSAWNKWGVGVGQIQKTVDSLSSRLSITRIETMKLMQSYEQGFNVASIKGAEQLLVNLKKAVGNNVQAMNEMEGALAGIQSRFPDLQRSMERLDDSDRRRLSSQSTLLVLAGKMDLSQAKTLQNYINGNKQGNSADEQKKKLLEEQLDVFGRIKKIFEDLSKVFADKIQPYLLRISDFIKNNGKYIFDWVDKWGKVALAIGAAAIAMTAFASTYATLKGVSVVIGLGKQIASIAPTIAGTSGGLAAAGGTAAAGGAGGIAGGIGTAAAAGGGGLWSSWSRKQQYGNGLIGPAEAPGPGFLSRLGTSTFGGITGKQGFGGGIGGSLGALGGIASAGLGGYEMGRVGYDLGGWGAEKLGLKSNGAKAAGSWGGAILAGAGAGALTGTMGGPVGIALGALIGGLGGLTAAIFKHKEQIDKINEDMAKQKAKEDGANDFRSKVEGYKKAVDPEKERAKIVSSNQDKYLTQMMVGGGNIGNEQANIEKEKQQKFVGENSDKSLSDLEEKLEKIQTLKESISGNDERAEGQRLEAAKEQKEVEERINKIHEARLPLEGREIALAGAKIAYANLLKINLEGSTELMNAMIESSQSIADNMSATGKVDFNKLEDSLAKVRDSMDAVQKDREEKLSFTKTQQGYQAHDAEKESGAQYRQVGLSKEDVEGNNISISKARNAAAALLKLKQDAKDSGNTKGADEYEKAIENVLNLGRSSQEIAADQLKTDTARRNMAQQIADIQVDRINASMKVGLGIAQQNVRAAEQDIALADNAGAGLAASVDMRMRSVAALTQEKELKEKSLDMLKQEYEAAKAKGDGAAEAKYLEQIKQGENDITDIKIKQLGITKQIREGYIGAIGAMVAGSGMFAKIMIDQEKNLGVGVKMGAVVQGMRSGGNRKNTTQASGWDNSMQYGIGGVGDLSGRDRGGQQQEFYNGSTPQQQSTMVDLQQRARAKLDADYDRSKGVSMAAQGAAAGYNMGAVLQNQGTNQSGGFTTIQTVNPIGGAINPAATQGTPGFTVIPMSAAPIASPPTTAPSVSFVPPGLSQMQGFAGRMSEYARTHSNSTNGDTPQQISDQEMMKRDRNVDAAKYQHQADLDVLSAHNNSRGYGDSFADFTGLTQPDKGAEDHASDSLTVLNIASLRQKQGQQQRADYEAYAKESAKAGGAYLLGGAISGAASLYGKSTGFLNGLSTEKSNTTDTAVNLSKNPLPQLNGQQQAVSVGGVTVSVNINNSIDSEKIIQQIHADMDRKLREVLTGGIVGSSKRSDHS